MSEAARTWALRLLALGIAIGIWFNASVEDRLASSEKVVEANVSYIRPRGYVIINPVRSVNVRLLGSKKAVRQLNPVLVDVQVELSRREEGSTTVTLGPENVLAPEGLEVVSIEPSNIRVELAPEIAKWVPVVPRLAGRPAPGVQVGEPEVVPNQAWVTGPKTMVDSIDSLATSPVNLTGHAATFEETVPVLAPDPLIQIVQSSRVTVRVPLQPLPKDQTQTAPRTRKEKT
ncbi:MAG TPA: CdaR family protein [Thermoanaerobaculia bacterium]